MIRSFKGKHAETILKGRTIPKGFPADIAAVTRRKLVMINNAGILDDLKSPPGNRLEALKGNLDGKHSTRVNDKWRIVFRWNEGAPEEVKIADYHD